MRATLLIAAALCAISFSGCKKRQPENIPQPKAETAAQERPVSTAPAVNQNPLTAPGNYLKTTVGQVQKARDAKALYEETAKQGLKSLDLNDTGGN